MSAIWSETRLKTKRRILPVFLCQLWRRIRLCD